MKYNNSLINSKSLTGIISSPEPNSPSILELAFRTITRVHITHVTVQPAQKDWPMLQTSGYPQKGEAIFKMLEGTYKQGEVKGK